MVSSSRRQNFYSKIYSDSHFEELKKKESEFLVREFGSLFKPKDTILDVGCGDGTLAARIKHFYGVNIYGIDLNEVGVEKAKKLGVWAKKGDIEQKWPYLGDFFDKVIVIQTLEHVINTDNIILEAKRVLKKGGFLIISTPNLANWLNRLIFIAGYQPFFTEVSLKNKTFGLDFTRKMTKNREAVGHIRVFTLKALLDFLHYYHFKVKLVKGGSISYLPWFLAPLDKLFSFFPSLASDLIVVASKSQ